MQVRSVQSYQGNFSQKNTTPSFKATYPVVYWVVETNGKCAPTFTYKLTKKLQGLLVRMINGSNKMGKGETADKVKTVVKSLDSDYGNMGEVRSYYDRPKMLKHSYRPIAYLITGRDVPEFDENYGKPIGRIVRECARDSAELNRALNDYALFGLNYVLSPFKRLVSSASGEPMELHAIFRAIRNSKNKVIGYELVEKDDAVKCNFYPQNSPDNPLVRRGYRKV